MDIFITLLTGIFAGIIADEFYSWRTQRFTPKKIDQIESVLNDKNNWKSTDYEEKIYFYEKDPQWQIFINEGCNTVFPRFKKFLDKEHDEIRTIHIKFNKHILSTHQFLFLDGYRVIIPLPKQERDTNGDWYDYYDLTDHNTKIFEIIGSSGRTIYNKKDSLKEVATFLNIKIHQPK